MTDREQSIIDLVALGHGNEDIAKRIGVTQSIVKNTLVTIYQRTGMNSWGVARVRLATKYFAGATRRAEAARQLRRAS